METETKVETNTKTKIKIVAQPIIVGEKEAFEQDELGRKDFGESLLNLVSLSSDELVISLDGKWGEGKTTFVKMWQGLLTENEIHSIYINAFENDYSDDSFMAIAGSITAYVEEHKSKDEGNFDNFKEKAKIVGSQLLPWSAKIAIKAATLGVIKDSDFNDIADDLAKGLSAAVDNFIGERLESHKKDLETIQSFKRLLSEIPTRINSEGDNPLVIIIDELDRCKPTYALDLIEKVKHLFSVKNIVFVLVMNREQLEKSVKSVYGHEFDAHTYLQKFINIETAIPKKTDEQHYDNDIAQYNRRLFELHQIQTWGDDVLEYLEALAKHFNLSLRQLERVYTNLAIFYATSAKNKIRVVPIASFLAVIKVIEPFVYEELLYQKISYRDLCTKTRLLDEKEYQNERVLQLIVKYLKFSLVPEREYNLLGEDSQLLNFHRLLDSYGIDREDIIPTIAKKLNMFTVA